MQFILTISLVFLVLLPLHAQVSLDGRVRDTEGQPLPYVNVLVLEPQDSSLVTGTVTDESGAFRLEGLDHQRWILKTTMIGYRPVWRRLDLTSSGPQARTVELVLAEDTQKLEEVVIQAQKPLYEKTADRTVVNVQSSTVSQGRSVLQVLANSPGVTVNQQSGSISMFGKSGVLVMIDGRMTRMPMEALVQMLDGMSAANTEAIELITSPPAEYDAEGNAGVINIRMIDNPDMGSNGSAGVQAGFNQGPTLGGNFNWQYRGRRINVFSDYSILSDENAQPWLDERTVFGESFDRRIRSDQQREPETTTQQFRAGMDYSLNDRTSASLLLTGYKRNWDMDGVTEVLDQVSPDTVVNTRMDLHESNIWKNGSLSLGIKHYFQDNHMLSVTADYLYYVNDNPSVYAIREVSPGQDPTENKVIVAKDTPIRFRIGKADYSNQLTDRILFRAGAKATVSTFNNDVLVRSLENGNLVTDPDFSNISEQDEKIWALYASAAWELSDKMKVDAGLRYEYTDSYLSTPEEPGLVDRQYDYLFPSLSLSRQLSDQNRMTLAISKRITRPTFNEIAPFVFFTGPSSFFTGNPALQPALTSQADLSYQHKQWWLSLKFSHTKDMIGPLQPFLDTDSDVQLYRSENMEYLRSWSLSSSIPLGITSWWELQADASLFYQEYETRYRDLKFRDEVFYVSLNATSQFSLPHDFSAEVSGRFQSAQLWGIWEFEPLGQLDIGFRKKWRQGVLALVFSDILHTNVWKSEMILPDQRSSALWEYDWNTRSVNLTYTYTFGNQKLKSVKVGSGSEEERKRVN